ncbi:MAG: coiled-coil domain-containing protein [Candidatus Hydrothermia bacterium]|jgi:cell division protein FtsB
MITLLLLSQITRDEFMDFKRQTEVQFAEIRGEIKELKSQIQALNQRINDLDKRIDDLDKKLNKRMDDLITYLWIFMGFITILIGFIIGFGLWDRRTYLKPVEEKKADKELVMKLEQKIENLEDENKRLKNQNQALIFILEKFINGASKEEIKSEIEIIKKMS